MSQNKQRVGVIGTGKMGTYHLQKYAKMDDVEIAGVFDQDEARAKQVAERFGVRQFSSLSELLFEVDAVSVTSSTASHFSISRQALESGVHVLVEKPMTVETSEAEELVRIARERNLVLQVGHIERFRFGALAEGSPLFPIRYIESHRLSPSLNREHTVDVVTDLMIHDLDLVLSLVGEDPNHVSAIGMPVLTSQYDIANVRLEFPSGIVANLSVSRVSAKTVRKFRIFSGSAYASMDFLENTADRHERSADGVIVRNSRAVPAFDSLHAQCREFIDCSRTGKRPTVTGEDGARAVKYAKIIVDKVSERSLLLLGQEFRKEEPTSALER